MTNHRSSYLATLLRWARRQLIGHRATYNIVSNQNKPDQAISQQPVSTYEQNMIKLLNQRIALAEKQIKHGEYMSGLADKIIASKDEETARLQIQINAQAVMIKMQEAHAETLKQMALTYAKQFIEIWPKYLMLTRPHIRVPDTFYHEIETLNLQLETGIIDEISYSAELNKLVVGIAGYA